MQGVSKRAASAEEALELKDIQECYTGYGLRIMLGDVRLALVTRLYYSGVECLHFIELRRRAGIKPLNGVEMGAWLRLCAETG